MAISLFLIFVIGVVLWFYKKSSGQTRDSMNMSLLNKKKWKIAFRFHQDTPLHSVEIKDDKMKISLISNGDKNKNEGSGANHLIAYLRSGKKQFRSIEARVQVDHIKMSKCAENKISTLLRTTLGAYYFNTKFAQPTSVEGDVFAVIGLAKSSTDTEPADILTLKAVVLHCQVPCYLRAEHAPPGAGVSQVLFEKDLGLVKVGESVLLGLQWDKEAHKFIFLKDRVPLTEYIYNLPEVGPPLVAKPHLDVAHFVPNCKSSDEDEMTSVFSDFKVTR